MKFQWIRVLTCSCALVLLFSTSVSATPPEGFESLESAQEGSEIKALQDSILQTINEIALSERPGQLIVFTSDDIDWSQAYKLYIETNIYELDDSSPQTIEQALSNGHAVWQLPISKDGLPLIAGIAVSQPLSEDADRFMTKEEQRRAQEKVGKWTCHTIATPENYSTSYRDQFEKILEQNGLGDAPVKLLMGGMSKMRSVSGIAMDGEKVLCVVPLDPPALTGEPKPETRATLPTLEENQVYSFEEMAQVMRAIPDEQADSGLAGGGNTAPVYEPPNYTVLLILTAVCGAVLVLICLSGRRRAKKL